MATCPLHRTNQLPSSRQIPQKRLVQEYKISLATGQSPMESIKLVAFLILLIHCIPREYLLCALADRGQKRSDVDNDVCLTHRKLQGGWAEYFDENEKKYYYHRSSDDTTQWEYPMDACDDEYGSYVRIARLIVKINGLHLCVREYPTMPILSYQYSGLLIEPSASWCWDPPERPGFCYIYFVKYFELDQRFMTLLLRRSTSSLRSRLLSMLGVTSDRTQDNTQYSIANPSNAEHHQLVNELIELMYRFNESFQYSNKHGASHGIVYKSNELYFTKNSTRLQLEVAADLGGDNGGVEGSDLDEVKDRILATFQSHLLPSTPFQSCTSPQLAFLLQIAEDSVHQKSSPRPFAWRDSELSATLYREVAMGKVESLSNRLISEELGEVDQKISEVRSADGRGVLWWAYEHENMQMVELLVKYGSWVEDRDAYGLKPHHLQKLRNSKAKRSIFFCKPSYDVNFGDTKIEEAIGTNGVNVAKPICAHEQEDQSDQIIDNIGSSPYIAPKLDVGVDFQIDTS